MLHVIVYKKYSVSPWLAYNKVFDDNDKAKVVASGKEIEDDWFEWLVIEFNPEVLQ